MTKEEQELDERVKAERKIRIANDRIRHKKDKVASKLIKQLGICEWPINMPSLDKAMWWDGDRLDFPYFEDGFQWIDKPHKCMLRAMSEIRALREYIVNQDEAFKNYRK